MFNKFIQAFQTYWLLIIIFLILIFFYFGELGTANFNQDGHLWYLRSQGFIDALKDHDWARTFQNPKPGVTVMWLSGISLETFLRLYELKYHFRPLIYTADTFKYVHFAAKAPLVLSAITFLLFYFFSLKKLIGKRLAYLALIILAFEPFFIGVNRLFYGDGLMVITMTASVLSMFLYNKEGKYRYLYLSAILGGLSFLSKMQAVYIPLFVSLYFLLETYFSKKGFKRNFLDLSVWFAIFITTIFIFFPALWVEPVNVLNKMFVEAVVMSEEGKNNVSPSNYYLLTIVGRLTYVTSLFFILGLFKISPTILKLKNRFYFYSVIFIFFYLIQMTLVSQKIDRYILPVFPFVAIISSYGVITTYKWVNSKLPKFKFKYLIGGVFLFYTLFAAYYYPYFPAFHNRVGGLYWGYHYIVGYDQVGEYLNSQPNSPELKVVGHTYPQSLRPYVKGTVYSRRETIPNGWRADYYVVDNNWTAIKKYSQCDELVKEIDFRDTKLWDIYKCRKL